MLYIDATQLVHWSGNLTGIPRVMNELAIRFAKKPSVKFIVWDPNSNNYKNIDIKKTLDQRGKQIFYISKNGKIISSSIKKSLFFRVVNKINENIISVPDGILREFDASTNEAGNPEINKDDKLLILWGEQASEKFIEKVKSIHKKGVKIIQVSYDLLPLVTPQYSDHSTESMWNYNMSIFPICSLILSISKSTKNDIKKWMKENRLKVPKIEVFRLGDDFKLSNPKKPTEINANEKFVLAVGTVEARKNHTLLYYVYKNAAEKKINLPKLVIVGRQGWKAADIFSLITLDPEVNKKITILTDISDEELAWLYKESSYSIYPSFYEGWGLPIAESISYGTPCLSSNTSSMPEIAGDLIKYFSPTSTDECLGLMIEYDNELNLKEAIINISKYKTTTWNQTYIQVDSLITEKT